jgi:hypothetical protein
MKKAVFMSLMLLISIALAGPAMANHFVDLVYDGTCDGWSVSGGVYTGWIEFEVTYLAELYEGTTLLEQYGATETVYGTDPTFSFSGSWVSELCGEYTVKITLHLTNDEDMRVLTKPVICDCPPPDVCTGTPGYWKNHEDAWPVDQLTIGYDTFTKSYLLDVFDWPTEGGQTQIKLFHHLVAAKLNLLMGATYEGIGAAVDAADDFFEMYPFFTEIDKDTKKMIDGLKYPLVMFNESMPCGETIDSYDRTNFMLGGSGSDDQEDRSWGAIKKIYK